MNGWNGSPIVWVDNSVSFFVIIGFGVPKMWLKPDLIKLDRILIQDIQDEPGKVAFVKGLVEAARTSNSIILAEGVETIEEFRVCKSLGVDLMQGFLFHRPSSIDLILEDFAKHEKLSEIDNDEEELSNVASIKKVGGAA